MKRTHKSLAFVIGLAVCFLAGCAATVSKPTAEARPLAASASPTAVALLITGSPTLQASADWHTFQAEWRTAFANAAASAGLPFTYLDAEGGEQPGGVVLARVTVTKYRYVTPGARFGFGIFTGNAYINADTEFFEFPGRRSIGYENVFHLVLGLRGHLLGDDRQAGHRDLRRNDSRYQGQVNGSAAEPFAPQPTCYGPRPSHAAELKLCALATRGCRNAPLEKPRRQACVALGR